MQHAAYINKRAKANSSAASASAGKMANKDKVSAALANKLVMVKSSVASTNVNVNDKWR